jgi:hypothetical protein
MGAESGGLEDAPVPAGGANMGLSADALAKRALVSEAALQAVMKHMPPSRLQEEGFFDDVVGIIKKVAPVVVKVAPGIINNLSPLVSGLLRKAGGQECGMADFRRTTTTTQTVRKMKSQPLIRGQDGALDFLQSAEKWHRNQESMTADTPRAATGAPPPPRRF